MTITGTKLKHGEAAATSGCLPRIATLLPFPLAHPGGVSTYVAGLSRAVSKAGRARMLLIAPATFQGGPGDHVSQVLLAARHLRELLRIRPDVVHTHEHPALLA